MYVVSVYKFHRLIGSFHTDETDYDLIRDEVMDRYGSYLIDWTSYQID